MNSENYQQPISLSDIPMQESEVVIVKDEDKKNDIITQSQQTDVEMGVSISDMRVLSQQAQIKQVRFSNGHEEGVTTSTRFIIRETDDDDETEEEAVDEAEMKKRKAEEDQLHFYGYFSWYWKTHGFWKAFKSFFGFKIVYGVVFSIFNSVGSAIGAFFFKRWFLKGNVLGEYC